MIRGSRALHALPQPRLASGETMKSFVVYHVALLGDWEAVLARQMGKIVASGLYEDVEAIYVCAVGPGAGAFTLPEHAKASVIHRSEQATEYEFPAIDFLRQRLRDDTEDAHVLYMHTKGVSYAPGSAERRCVDAWREYMEYFTVENFEQCRAHLETHDVSGVHWTGPDFVSEDYHHPAHFQGNFWWANARYLRTLPDSRDVPCGRRLQRMRPEFWIGSNPAVRAKSLFRANVDLYREEVRRELYAGSPMK
jgi:hypothetical protein